MPAKNYYIILGVPREETQGGISARYRDLVKRLHPDVAGADSTPAFQEVSEAYQVLSDPEHRRQHNRELRARELGGSPIRAEPPAASQPSSGRPVRRREPVSIHDFQTVRPSLQELMERVLRNFTGVGVPKSEHLEPLNLEVILTPEEASRDSLLPLRIPVFRPCRQYNGSGRDWVFICPRCGGGGLTAEVRTIDVRIPPNVRSTAVLDVSLGGVGYANLYVRLHVRVAR